MFPISKSVNNVHDVVRKYRLKIKIANSDEICLFVNDKEFNIIVVTCRTNVET